MLQTTQSFLKNVILREKWLQLLSRLLKIFTITITIISCKSGIYPSNNN